MLHYFDQFLFIYIEIDVLGFVILRILSQQYLETSQWHLVVFWSSKKLIAKMNYDIGKLEILFIVEACKQ